jgi:hypothetical protein
VTGSQAPRNQLTKKKKIELIYNVRIFALLLLSPIMLSEIDLKLRLKDYQAELQWKKFVNWEQLYKSKIW